MVAGGLFDSPCSAAPHDPEAIRWQEFLEGLTELYQNEPAGIGEKTQNGVDTTTATRIDRIYNLLPRVDSYATQRLD